MNRRRGIEKEWFKTAPWTKNEIFYMVNHVATLTGVYGSFQKAVEVTSFRINRKPEHIIKMYERKQNVSCYRPG
jgi:hypothetical protein